MCNGTSGLRVVTVHVGVVFDVVNSAGTRHGLGGSAAQKCYLASTVKHTAQELGGELLRNFQILIVPVVKIWQQCLQTASPYGDFILQAPYWGVAPGPHWGPWAIAPPNENAWLCLWI